MSMQPRQPQPVPEETQRVAHAAFPRGHLYLRIRDELGILYDDQLFADLFSSRGQPAESPGRLALVTVLQFAEGLSDRQAADAVRGRIDWKYALGLELTDPGFHYSVLTEFRQRLIVSRKAQELLDVLLRTLKERALLKERGRQRTDSTHVLAAVRTLNRLELVGETMRRALNELADAAPDWLPGVIPTEWFTRYSRQFDSLRLPKSSAGREQLILTIGLDGLQLLSWLWTSSTDTAPLLPEQQVALRCLPGVELLRQVWVQQFWIEHGAGDDDSPDLQYSRNSLRLRADDNQPPGEHRIHSPYDAEARYSAKRELGWVGYKVHLTETCEAEQPHLITHVATTTAVVQDVTMPEQIHLALADKELLPSQHLMDAGYVAADLLVTAERDFAIEICGPVKKDVRWQANTAGGYSLAAFQIDWTAGTVRCPEGQQTTLGREHRNAYDKAVIQVKFKATVCRACPAQAQCTRAKRGGRSLVIRPEAQHSALQQLRQEQQTPEFWRKYAQRSGIEGTISQGVRAYTVRRARYIGLAKTHLQMVAAATAINLHRLFDWLTATPRATTRISAFAQLAPDPGLVPTGWRAY